MAALPIAPTSRGAVFPRYIALGGMRQSSVLRCASCAQNNQVVLRLVQPLGCGLGLRFSLAVWVPQPPRRSAYRRCSAACARRFLPPRVWFAAPPPARVKPGANAPLPPLCGYSSCRSRKSGSCGSARPPLPAPSPSVQSGSGFPRALLPKGAGLSTRPCHRRNAPRRPLLKHFFCPFWVSCACGRAG